MRVFHTIRHLVLVVLYVSCKCSAFSYRPPSGLRCGGDEVRSEMQPHRAAASLLVQECSFDNRSRISALLCCLDAVLPLSLSKSAAYAGCCERIRSLCSARRNTRDRSRSSAQVQRATTTTSEYSSLNVNPRSWPYGNELGLFISSSRSQGRSTRAPSPNRAVG